MSRRSTFRSLRAWATRSLRNTSCPARAESGSPRRVGAAKHVRVAVTELHYKNAAKSLLIGDANFAKAKVTMIDAATGRVQGEGDATALDQVAINGVIGAIISAAQDKEKVDKRLADGLARDVMTTVYGATAAAEARKRPFGAPAEPSSPEVAPKPAAPAKEVPVAAAGKRRTAMATQPAGAPAAR